MKAFSTIFKSISPHTSHTAPRPQTELTAANHTPHSGDTTTSSGSALTVIELFQSQGCNSCPPANEFCLANFPPNGKKYLFLTYEVTYWDHLGWPDTFGDKRWDARQRDYATVLGQRSVYTPQVIVNGGARPLGGSGWRGLPAVLSNPSQLNLNMELVSGENGKGMVRLSNGNGKYGDVLVVFYETQPEGVKILRGENRGETLPHRNVVRDIQVIGEWKGGDENFALPASRKDLEMAVLVQAGRGGEILGAAIV